MINKVIGLNFIDTYFRKGVYKVSMMPFTPGLLLSHSIFLFIMEKFSFVATGTMLPLFLVIIDNDHLMVPN